MLPDIIQMPFAAHKPLDAVQNTARQSCIKRADAEYWQLQTSNETPWFHFYRHTSHENKPVQLKSWNAHRHVLWAAASNAGTRADAGRYRYGLAVRQHNNHRDRSEERRVGK